MSRIPGHSVKGFLGNPRLGAGISEWLRAGTGAGFAATGCPTFVFGSVSRDSFVKRASASVSADETISFHFILPSGPFVPNPSSDATNDRANVAV
jgi:hypothetical protein